jgi:hypothetical protein
MKRIRESITTDETNSHLKKRRVNQEGGEYIVLINFLILLPFEILLVIINNDLRILNRILNTCRDMYNLFNKPLSNTTLLESTVLKLWKNDFKKEYLDNAKIPLIEKLLAFPIDISRSPMDIPTPVNVYLPFMKMIDMQCSNNQQVIDNNNNNQHVMGGNNNQVIIAGDFVLQYLCKKEFKDTDIVILFSCDPIYNDPIGIALDIDLYIQNILSKCFGTFNPISPFFKSRFLRAFYPGNLEHVRRIYVWILENLKIRIIFLTLPPGMTLINYIDEHFSFSFCKCWFDGTTIGTNHLFEQIRRVGRINSTINIESDSYLIKNRPQRIKKYIDRDFMFLNDEKKEE